jgi:hypothetical protein
VAAARRGFLKAVAIAPLVPGALAPAPAAAGAAAPPGAGTGAGGVAEALAEALRREHGAHLDADALARVTKEIAASLESAARLRRAVPLGNADEPVTLFQAARAAGGEDRR